MAGPAPRSPRSHPRRWLVAGALLIGTLPLLAEGSGPVGPTCPASHLPDPDGAAARLEAARTTALLRPSHPVRNPLVGRVSVQPRRRNASFVDEEIFGTMAAAGVAPAPRSSDHEFLRRVTLDLTGRIPSETDVRAFVADTSGSKRTLKVDELLASDAFVDRWTLFLDDLFRNTYGAFLTLLSWEGRNAFHTYLRESIRTGKRYDDLARELITALGESCREPAGNFIVRDSYVNPPTYREDEWDNLAVTTDAVFLGASTFCIQCHDGRGHTDQISQWLSSLKRRDAWGMSAFYAGTSVSPRGGVASCGNLNDVRDDPSRPYRLGSTSGNKAPRDPDRFADGATTVDPRFILTGEGPRPGELRRVGLARIVTGHPQFARAAVNYLWKELFTVGIVEPADGFDFERQDPANPPASPWTVQPTHPRLLERLGVYFVEQGYSLKAVLRLLATSDAYQLSSTYPGEWKPEYAPLFARHFVRRLRSEELFDAIVSATGVPASIPVTQAQPVGRAGALPDVNEPNLYGATSAVRDVRDLLDAFLRGDRLGQKRSGELTLQQSVAMMTSPVLASRLSATTPGSTLSRLLQGGAEPSTIVRSLFLSTISRPPSADEERVAIGILGAPDEGRSARAEDLLFILHNMTDFVVCY